ILNPHPRGLLTQDPLFLRHLWAIFSPTKHGKYANNVFCRRLLGIFTSESLKNIEKPCAKPNPVRHVRKPARWPAHEPNRCQVSARTHRDASRSRVCASQHRSARAPESTSVARHVVSPELTQQSRVSDRWGKD